MTRFASRITESLKRTAETSDCGTYRYDLTRTWDPKCERLTFIMLNPSIADSLIDDPTIRRCVGFAKRNGFSGIVVRNLYALRATDPRALLAHHDPIGDPMNGAFLRELADGRPVVCAWGTSGGRDAVRRGQLIAYQLSARGARLFHLGLTKDGYPRHPLYLRGDAPLTEWLPMIETGAVS